jgi:hypothetical protein
MSTSITKVVKTRKKAGGRVAGVPNKVTQEAREAIAMFVDNNAHRLEYWLTSVAEGDPKHDIKPNPAKAFEMFQSVVEYHVPKLARTELTGADQGAIEMVVKWANEK